MTSYLDNDEIIAAAELASVLRAFLRARREPTNVIASAIAYETAALFAKDAPSLSAADQIVDVWAREMKKQIRRLGIGVEHP